jgi:outer membrane protein TolC
MLLTAAVLAVGMAGCRAVPPEMAKNADDVRVSIDEADRAFLYSAADQERLLTMRRPSGKAGAPRLYTYRSDTRELVEVTGTDLAAVPGGGDVLLAISAETHAASINLWNWIEGDVTQLSLRLDSLSAHRVAGPEGDGQSYDVVFAAREGALLPFCRDRDYELFKARLSVDAQSACATLLDFEQLTHNSWDDVQPSFSPDGHWVVFVTRRLGPRNVALMDANGDFMRLLAPSEERSSYFPVVLPNNEECLYVSEVNGVTEFFVCGLDAQGHRRASAQELKQMLFSWDDRTRHAYLLTDIFAREQSLRLLLDLPRTLGSMDLLLLGEWNSPLLKQYREKILAARDEREHNQLARGARVSAVARHMLDAGVVVDETEDFPFDRAVQGFTRLLFTLSLPLFQGPLNKAIEQRDMWQEMVYSQTYLKAYNELVHNVAVEHVNYSEQTAKADILRRVLDLQRKRKFLWEARQSAGRELPAKVAEADGYVAEAEAEPTAALGKAQAARARLCAAIGLQDVQSVKIDAMALEWEAPPLPIPPLEQFQALTQVNHPDLARLKFLELRAAAIRDMGAPGSRERPTLDLTYGHGSEHFFSQVVDDFISVTLGHSMALGQLGANKEYRKQWTHELLAYRQLREQARLDLNADLQEAYSALQRTVGQLESARSWRELMAEKMRLSRIYAPHRVPTAGRAPSAAGQIDAQIDYLRQLIAGVEVRAEFYRQMAGYYLRAGLGRKFISVMAQEPQTDRANQRSVWLWQSLSVVLDPTERRALLQLCAEQGITRIYCFVSRVGNDLYLEKHNWEFGYFLDLCRARGIEVYALVGNPHWVNPSHREEIGARIRSIVQFNARAQEGRASFAGLKLDVEPHALPRWQEEAGRAELVGHYLEMLQHVEAVLGRDGDGLPIAVDIPYTYADVALPGGEDTFLQAICDAVDEITLMAYLNAPEDIVERSLPVLEAAREGGVPVEVGVETTPGQPPGISFAEGSLEDLILALDRLYERFVAFENFAGFAIHDYTHLVQLIERSHGRQISPH